jgi:hypothetical protein
LTLLLALATLTAQAATYTFKSGAKFEGDVVEHKGTNALVVRSDRDGKLYTLYLTNLTELDQMFITGKSPTASDYAAARRAEADRADAGKTMPEQPEDSASASGQIIGAFGLKLGQKFDLKYAVSTNKTEETMTLKGEVNHINLNSYYFRPKVPLPNFDSYIVHTTPCSNLVYAITAYSMDFESFSAACDESDKLLAVLQQKYGKAHHWLNVEKDCEWNTITQGTREVTLFFRHFTNSMPGLSLSYTDNDLHRQAQAEQITIDAADSARAAERKKLKQQL